MINIVHECIMQNVAHVSPRGKRRFKTQSMTGISVQVALSDMSTQYEKGEQDEYVAQVEQCE